GLENVFRDLPRYPEILLEDLSALQPEVVILSSEPYTFTETHVPEFQRACPMAKVVVADATFFSWYGSRLLRAPAYFAHLLTYLQMN
ncbi:MAG: helical backbone metal receptor, partial [Saprospiraceae bacterium]|nr:helical backbone metal receptor [Saprospiraceae bacterium]